MIITRNQFRLSNISILSSKKQVEDTFRKPDSTSPVRTSEVTGDTSIKYYYKGLVIHLNGNKVFNIKCTRKKYWTPDSVHVSSTKEDIKRAYGDVIEENSDTVRLYPVDFDAMLIFRLQKGMVIEIELWFDYT